MFHPNYDVSRLVGAMYNPRQINEESLAMLQGSIRDIGMVKPVIATEKNTIIAGHQRTKALQAMGATHGPVFVIKSLSPEDEVLFNQLHNGSDIDSGEERCSVAPSKDNKRGYTYVDAKTVRGKFRSPGAAYRSETAKLLMRNGNWGACVATFEGKVLTGATYAMACYTVGIDPRVFYVDKAETETIIKYFAQEYGVFSYRHIPKTHSLQSFAQLYRLRNKKNPRLSTAYEEWVKPTLQRDERMLDLFCGQGDYVRYLQKRAYNIRGIELFFRRGWSINKTEVRRRIDAVIADVKANGLYDHVLCDYVMNSVVSRQAEHDVLTCISAFCKPGGTVYVSGRFENNVEGSRTARGGTSNFALNFVDDEGFSGKIHMGGWFFQLYHTKERVNDLIGMYYNAEFERKYGNTWQTRAKKSVAMPVEVAEESIRREFNLPWPDGETISRSEELIEVWRPAYEAAHAGLTPTTTFYPEFVGGQ